MTGNWDLFIAMAFVVMTVYGLLLGRGRIFTIVLSSYVGFVVANEFGQLVFDKASSSALVNNAVGSSYFGAKVVTFAAVVFLLTLKGELFGEEEHDLRSTMITALYGFLAAGLIITTIMSFMGDTERANILSGSQLASQIYSYKPLWIVAPVAAVLVSSVIKGRRFNRR